MVLKLKGDNAFVSGSYKRVVVKDARALAVLTRIFSLPSLNHVTGRLERDFDRMVCPCARQVDSKASDEHLVKGVEGVNR